VLPGSVTLDGQPIDPNASVRVTVNSFLAAGGDNFSVLKQGRGVATGMMDIEAFEAYVKAHPLLAPGPLDRIVRLD
jgi:5'-nucleotidase